MTGMKVDELFQIFSVIYRYVCHNKWFIIRIRIKSLIKPRGLISDKMSYHDISQSPRVDTDLCLEFRCYGNLIVISDATVKFQNSMNIWIQHLLTFWEFLGSYKAFHLISGWQGNCIHYKVWEEITYPFSKFNGATVEVCWSLGTDK